MSTRTAALEQEIENLKKKLAASTRDNLNLQEELSEAYRIKVRICSLSNLAVCSLLCTNLFLDLSEPTGRSTQCRSNKGLPPCLSHVLVSCWRFF